MASKKKTSEIPTRATMLTLCSGQWSMAAMGMVCVGLASLFLIDTSSSYIVGTATTAKSWSSSKGGNGGVRNGAAPPPPPLDPHIRLIPLQAFHPCEDEQQGIPKGTIMPLHVSCLTTIIVESDDAIQAFEEAIPSSPELLTLLCKEFQSVGNNEEGVLLTCVQTPDRLGALVRQQPEQEEEYGLVFPSEASTIVAAVLKNEVDDHSVRIVERKTAVMHGYYQPRSPAHDARREINGNSGNFVWWFGATRLFNPATTLLIRDSEYYKMIAHAKKNGITPTRTASAYIIALANILHLEHPTKRINEFYDHMKFYEVPIIVTGMGMQASFEFIDDALATSANNTTPATPAELWQKDTTQPPLTGDPVYEAVTNSQIQLLQDNQVRALNKMQQMQLPGSKGIGVRGELTRIVCSNSGIQNCINTGCPTLMISRHANLGGELKKKWQALQQELQNSSSKKTLKIALTLPAVNSNNGASERDKKDYGMLVDLLLRIAQSQHDVVFNIQTVYDVPRFEKYIQSSSDPAIQALNGNLVFKKYDNTEEWLADASRMDLFISNRIHGSMVGFATAVPTVLIPIDLRIQELVDSMYLPHLSMSDVAALPSNGEVNSLLLEILQRARYQDFDHFEQNRLTKMRHWHDMIYTSGLEMDPSLVKIMKSSS